METLKPTQRSTCDHIVILTSATGGGHNACAAALSEAFHSQLGPSVRVTIVDPWRDHAPWPLNRFPDGYFFITKYLPTLWLVLWHMLANPLIDRIVFGLIGLWIRHKTPQAIQALKPDLIVAVHPLVQRAIRQAIHLAPPAKLHPSLPPLQTVAWFTVVTDLVSIHPLWFDRGVTRCFVPTKAAAMQALANKLSSEQVILSGLPSIHDACTHRSSTLPTVLVMGGAEGMGQLKSIVRSIDKQFAESNLPAAQMVIICGKNERLRNRLSNQQWHMPVKILGFVDDVPKWMSASDLLVTKAGPSTIVEGLNAGLPILLTGYLRGQEAGNVNYVVENGAGVYCTNPEQIGSITLRWLVECPEERLQFARRAKRMAHHYAASEIAERIINDYNAYEFVPPQVPKKNSLHPANRSTRRVKVY